MFHVNLVDWNLTDRKLSSKIAKVKFFSILHENVYIFTQYPTPSSPQWFPTPLARLQDGPEIGVNFVSLEELIYYAYRTSKTQQTNILANTSHFKIKNTT